MKLEIRHYGKVKEGKIIWDIPDLYRQQLLELEGQDIVVVMKKRHSKPSQSQYGYYRGAILMTCFHTEMFSHLDKKDDLHDLYFAPRFLSFTSKVNIGGKEEEIKRVRSLTDLSKEEMNEFITKVIAHCQEELNISIPPSELFYSKYYEK